MIKSIGKFVIKSCINKFWCVGVVFLMIMLFLIRLGISFGFWIVGWIFLNFELFDFWLWICLLLIVICLIWLVFIVVINFE